MKIQIHTIRYGNPDWMAPCVESLENWVERHGYDLVVWDDPEVWAAYPDPKYTEIDAIRHFLKGDADAMAYFDADVWLHPEAPEIPVAEGLALHSCRLHRLHGPHWREWCGKPMPDWNYANAGVWTLDREAAKMLLAEALPPYRCLEGFLDQHDFNMWAASAMSKGMKVSELPPQWNTWGREFEPAWAYHLWGTEKLRDLDDLRRLGFLDHEPDGKRYCFHPEGSPAQDKVIVLQFVKDSGLGNRLFELAAGIHLGQRLGLPVLLNWLPTEKRDFGLKAFGIGVMPFQEFPVVSARLGQGNLEIVDKAAHAIHDSKERFPAVSHPFQSEECFAPVADKIRELFKLEPLPLEVPEGRTPVAVQVRRGDYVAHRNLNVTTPGYFINGMDFIRKRIKHPHFFVVSDDPAWCRQQFGHLPDVTIMPPQSPVEGLRTMVACEAHIISNSTFGWWGAWLGEKGPVVVPDRWANNMKVYGRWQPAPDRWHKMATGRPLEQRPVVSPAPQLKMEYREYPQQFERAIVIPWHAKQDKWQSLRYCLRSIHTYFEDRDCPIVVLGTARPSFLTFRKHRVIYQEAWAYQEALMRGVQIAGQVAFFNDDTKLLRSTGWEDLRRPYHFSEIPEELLEKFRADPNPWRTGFLKAYETLKPMVPEVKNFSVHLPYLYRREQAIEVLEAYGAEFKMPFELYYFNLHGAGARVLNGERVQGLPFGEARFLNHTDNLLTEELKNAVATRFPDWAPWEARISF